MNIQIFNLNRDTVERDLRKLFSAFGSVTSADVMRDKLNGRSKRVAIIEMPVEREARQAIESLHLTEFEGMLISVSELQTKSQW